MYLCCMMNEATWQFVQEHCMEDVRRLALCGAKAEGVDMLSALQQIAGWQMARKKLPSWADIERIVYPPHLNMEQCSSERTAKYKRSILSSSAGKGVFVDLTGGFGVDLAWMSTDFERRIYVEQRAELCDIVRYNFPLLGVRAEVVCADAVKYLRQMGHANVVFLDPARRDGQGNRTYGIADCTPNVIDLLPLLREKADCIVLKLSPMLDWRKAVDDLKCVSEVHIVSIDNECKELLLVVRNQPSNTLRLVCVNDDDVWEVPVVKASYGQRKVEAIYLYEPNASIMKAGCFREVEQVFGVQQLAVNSHLFVSERKMTNFPGRQFVIDAMTSMNKQQLKAHIGQIEYANVAVRNFPMTAEQLRKKLKLKDGGEVYIFGTTLQDGTHQLFICRKIG